MNQFENFIRFFSPSLALVRARANHVLNQIRSYDAGSHSKRTTGWRATNQSVNGENQNGLMTLRARSRELVRNNAYAKKAIQIISNNTVGLGIRPKVVSAKKRDKKIMDAWKAWAETTQCDFDGNFNFYGLQALVMKAVPEAGEVLIRKRKVDTRGAGAKNIIPVKLQIIEADLLDHYKNLDNGVGKGYILQGVEFDAKGKKLGYWLYDRHPYDMMGVVLNSQFVSIDEVIHVYSVERPGQVRGVPFLTPSMMKLRDFDDYEDAQLTRQKIAACFAVFISDNAENITSNIKGTTKNADGSLSERVTPGLIEHLPAGKQVSFGTPPGTTGYGEYSKTQLRGIAAGIGVTYEALTGDLSNVNFSSGRMGWLEFHRQVQAWQSNLVIPKFCAPAWEWFLEGYTLQYGTYGDIATTWTPPRREMIDPVKEVKGMTDEIRAGLASWADTVSELGYDPEELMETLAKEYKQFRDNELMLSCDPRYDATRSNDPMTPPDPNKKPIQTK
jgi:lambda family phage portal protein